MKKLLAALCASALLLCLSTSAFASSGVSIKPRSGEWNGVTWEETSGPLASLSFRADSDPETFYSKLSSDWSDNAYQKLFDDQDAYLFDFVGNPLIPAVSLPTLLLYSPYVDEDGEPLADKKVTVYRTDNGKLTDVTKSFSAGYDTNNDPVLVTGTRKLGTYIIAEKKVDMAKAAEIDAAIAKKAGKVPAASTPAPAATGKKIIRLPAYAR